MIADKSAITYHTFKEISQKQLLARPMTLMNRLCHLEPLFSNYFHWCYVTLPTLFIHLVKHWFVRAGTYLSQFPTLPEMLKMSQDTNYCMGIVTASYTV